MNINNSIDWKCFHTWKKSAKNTLWCLVGCSIGDFGTILFFQYTIYELPILYLMVLAIINGIILSIFLETLILIKQMNALVAFKTACKMSILSMIAMELSMNITDYLIIGDAKIYLWMVPIMLLAGFLTPLPYNYWRLKKYNISCH